MDRRDGLAATGGSVGDLPLKMVGRRRDTLTELAYKELLDAILWRRLRPGEPLRLDRLAEQLGMSRTPVNLALSRLHAEGLASYSEHVGFLVRVLTEQDVREIFDARLMCELHAVSTGLATASPTRIEEVVQLHEQIQLSTDWADAEAYRRFWELDGQFHRGIVRLASNGLLQEWFGQLHYHMHGVRLGFLSRQAGPFVLMLQEHAAIVNAVKQRDVLAAERGLRQHITRSCEVSIARLATSGDATDRVSLAGQVRSTPTVRLATDKTRSLEDG